jgi:N-methylhydantoinase A/oxoprolinase/acetone carboxylase beta subunit
MRLYPAAAAEALERWVCRPLNLELDQAALAIVRIASENMVHAIEEITINRGSTRARRYWSAAVVRPG